MTKAIKNAKTLRNDANAVDVNTEIKAIMTGNVKNEGREMSLALAIWQAPEVYNVAGLLGGIGYEGKRRAAVVAKLCEVSEDFRVRNARIATKTKAVKTMAKGGTKLSAYNMMQMQFAVTDDKNAVAAAAQMFERALFGAYYLRCEGVVSVNVKGTFAEIVYSTDRKDAEGMVLLPAGSSDFLRVGELRKAGETLFKANSTSAPRSKKKAETKSSLESLKAAPSIAAASRAYADIVNKMPDADTDELLASDEGVALLSTLIRKQFADANTIHVSELVDFIREHVSNVKIEIDVTPSKPVIKATKAA